MLIKNPTNENTAKQAKFTQTILAPVGVEYWNDTIIPTTKHTTDTITDEIITVLYLLHTLIEERLGNIIKLDIRSAPIIRIPITTVIAVSTARIILYAPAFVPVAFAKFSSKVTAKILL